MKINEIMDSLGKREYSGTIYDTRTRSVNYSKKFYVLALQLIIQMDRTNLFYGL